LAGNMNSTGPCDRWEPRALAVALGRWCLGMLFLFFGISKFVMGTGAFVTMMSQPFEKTWLPLGMVRTFGQVLPYAEVTLGAVLLLGIFRNVALFGTGVLLILLTFGQVVLGGGEVIFFNTGYLFMTAAVLFLNHWDLWVLFPRRGKLKPAEPAAPGSPP
jgi:Methylamine utilisation protein MauE